MTRELTEDEIRRLYAIAMAYDNRKPSEAGISAWWEQSRRGRWEYNQAADAIHVHHMESTEYLMPAHVTAIIRRTRQTPDVHTPLLPAAPPAPPERIRDIISTVSRRLGWTQRSEHADDEAVLAVKCPYCHAAPRRPCTRLVTRGSHRGEHQALKNFHDSRVQLAHTQEPTP
jgi:hypothetical protein